MASILPTRVQTDPLTFWNMYESGCDTAWTPTSNHKTLSAAAFLWKPVYNGLNVKECKEKGVTNYFTFIKYSTIFKKSNGLCPVIFFLK